MKKFISILALLPAILSASPCLDLVETKQLFFSGQREKALLELKCLSDGGDREAKRFLSDIFWLEGNVEASVEEAKKALDNLTQTNELSLHLARRIAQWRTQIQIQTVRSEKHSTHEEEVEVTYRYYKKNVFGVDFTRASRLFYGGPALSDKVITLNHLTHWKQNVYLENALIFAADTNFSPRWSVYATPHLVLSDETDLSLRASFRNYETQNVWSFEPMVQRSFLDLFWLGGSLNFIISPEMAVNGTFFADWKMHPRVSFRIQWSTGRNFEMTDLIDYYHDYLSLLRFSLLPNLELNTVVQWHIGGIRREERYGVGAKWIF